MKYPHPIRMSASHKTNFLLWLFMVIILAIFAGLSGLIYNSTFSPLIFLSGIAAIIIFIIWLARPVWALYATLVLVFLPLGLIPANIQSLLNRFFTFTTIGVWVIRLIYVRQKIRLPPPALLMLLFLIWSSITIFWAENLTPAAIVLQGYLLRFLLFLTVMPNEINTKQDLDGLMKTLAFSGWILMFSVIRILLLDGYTAGSRLKIFSENENGTGTLAMVAMVGVLWQVSHPSGNRGKLRWLITTIYVLLTFMLVAMSGSRGSALSMVLTLVVFWIWKPLRSWTVLAFIMGILALIFIPSLFTTLIDRFAITPDDTLLGGREMLWKSAWLLIKNHPLTGIGIGNAPYAMIPYGKMFRNFAGFEVIPIHNPILTVWVETGLAGLIMYLGILASSVWNFIYQYKCSKKQGNEWLMPYFGLIASVFLGYLFSWIKGGAMESSFSFFLFLALLWLPVNLNATTRH